MPKCVVRRKTDEAIENKGEFCDLRQIEQMENCAIRDAVAQLKTNWRRFDGTVRILIFARQKILRMQIFCHGQPNQTLRR
jgi:hypothetical protein